MIETSGLTKKFGGVVAVSELSLEVKKGEIFGFLGPNGAGKTTTIRMLCCLISKTSGRATLGGLDTGDEADAMKIRKMVGLLPENVGLYEEMGAYANLDFYGRLYEVSEDSRKESIARLLKMLGLWEKRDTPVGGFSKGMKQKVAVARALVHDPQVLFLDEPTANLDPESTKTVRDFILELKKEDRTIFLNTHNLDEAQRVCDRIGIMKTNLVTVGSPDELKASLWGTKTVVQLERLTDGVLAAVKALDLAKVVTEGNRLVIDVDDIEEQNPNIIQAIVSAGGRVQLVSEVSPTLEDVYLQSVRK